MSDQNFVLVTLHRVATHDALSDQHQSAWSATSALVQESFPNLKFSTNFMEEETFNILNILLQPRTDNVKKVNSFYIIMPSQYFDLYTKMGIPYQYDNVKGIPNDNMDPFVRAIKLIASDFDSKQLMLLIRSMWKLLSDVINKILYSMIRFGCSIYDCDLSHNIKCHNDLVGFITTDCSSILVTQELSLITPSSIVQWIKGYLPQNPPTCIDICNKDIVQLLSLPAGRLTVLSHIDGPFGKSLYHTYYEELLRNTEELCMANNISIQINWIWSPYKGFDDFGQINSLIRDKSYSTKIYDSVLKLPQWSPIIFFEPDVVNHPDIVYVYSGQFNKDKLQYNPTSNSSGDYRVKTWLEKKVREYDSGKTLTIVRKIAETHDNPPTSDYDLVINVGCPTIDLSGTICLSVTGGEPIITVNDGTPTIHVTGGAPKITIKKGKPNIKLQGGKPHITYV